MEKNTSPDCGSTKETEYSFTYVATALEGEAPGTKGPRGWLFTVAGSKSTAQATLSVVGVGCLSMSRTRRTSRTVAPPRFARASWVARSAVTTVVAPWGGSSRVIPWAAKSSADMPWRTSDEPPCAVKNATVAAVISAAAITDSRRRRRDKLKWTSLIPAVRSGPILRQTAAPSRRTGATPGARGRR